jgi:hypothetical protein
MNGYTKTKTVEKHNHKDYLEYDESVKPDESTMWTRIEFE